MFAVIKTGGKQYRVAAEDVIRVDRLNGQPGEIVEFGEVLVVGGDTPQLGTPTVAGATVAGEVLQHTRGDKVIAFKKRRRKNSRRKRGYRHEFSLIRITEILTGGARPSKPRCRGPSANRNPSRKPKLLRQRKPVRRPKKRPKKQQRNQQRRPQKSPPRRLQRARRSEMIPSRNWCTQ